VKDGFRKFAAAKRDETRGRRLAKLIEFRFDVMKYSHRPGPYETFSARNLLHAPFDQFMYAIPSSHGDRLAVSHSDHLRIELRHETQ
jgi:hypothetical protein